MQLTLCVFTDTSHDSVLSYEQEHKRNCFTALLDVSAITCCTQSAPVVVDKTRRCAHLQPLPGRRHCPLPGGTSSHSIMFCKRTSGSARRVSCPMSYHQNTPLQHRAYPSNAGRVMLPGTSLLERTEPTVVAPASTSVMSSPTSRALQPAATAFVPSAPLSGDGGRQVAQTLPFGVYYTP